jgi:hypothetical protein
MPEMNDALMNDLLRAGKISPETAEMWRSKNPPVDSAPVMDAAPAPAAIPQSNNSADLPWYERPLHDVIRDKYNAIQDKTYVNPFDPNYAEKRAALTGRAPAGVPAQPGDVSGPAPASVEGQKTNIADLAIPREPQKMPTPMDFGMGELDKSYDLQAKGIQGTSAAQSKGYEQQAKILEDVNKQNAGVDERIVNLQNQRIQESDKRLKEIENMAQEVNKETQINPNRYWQNLSTGNKVAASISIGLGAIGAAMLGSNDNKAWNIINGAIDRDIEAQKSNVQNNRYKLSNAENLYGLMLHKYGDQEAALMATKAIHLGQAENMIKAQMARTNSDVAKAQGNVLLGQVKQEQTKLGVALKMQTYQLMATRQATVGDGIENPAILPEHMQKRAVKMPNGLFRVASTDEGANLLNKESAAAKEMIHTLNKMTELQNRAGREIPWSDASKEAAALMSRLTFQNQQLEGINRLTDPDIHLINKQMGDPTAFRQDASFKLLDQMRDHVNSKIEGLREQYIPNYKRIGSSSAPNMRR